MPTLASSPVAVSSDQTSSAVRTNSPSVLFVDQSGQLGGAEFSLMPLAATWGAPHEVLLLSDGPFRARLESLGVPVSLVCEASVSQIRKDTVRLNWLRALPGILRQVRAIARRARAFDILFLNTQKALVLGALGKPLHRKKIVWYLHDVMSREHFGLLQRFVVRWLVRYAVDHVVANSRASAQSLVALAHCAPDAVPVVHNGIDLGAFSGRQVSDVGALRRRLGLPEGVYLAGLFGRLAPWKGQHIALEALARLPHLHLVLVGSALFGEEAYVEALHEQAARLGVQDRVIFAGFHDDMPAWMMAMDVILHTSTEPEPFGRVIVEGMAAGRPVIASAAGGVVEIVEHARNGWLVPPGDPAALAEAIETLRGAPALASALVLEARAEVAKRFSVEVYLDRMRTLLARADDRSQTAKSR
ncbi:glycosyltransferase involved in cell wall biosynthesis [Paraburkholderia unamae]|uniref:glycosyltransferase family 4 protein n=1 Tax=Paraburkholderia unamae TaxID=219649 RepID=UPI000DC2D1EB|nr:glycosyltransferase family 4 protein [Paraburkholderia unamae]RAR60571.1 glycosyltransferase involved in cell wall biosynthesis [Paraburkholderia unamae]